MKFKKGDVVVNVSDDDRDIPIGYEVIITGVCNWDKTISFRDNKGISRCRIARYYKLKKYTLEELKELLSKAQEDVYTYDKLIKEYNHPIEVGTKYKSKYGKVCEVMIIEGKYFLYCKDKNEFYSSYGVDENDFRGHLMEWGMMLIP